MNKTIRNLVFFAFFTVGGGWLGIWLNNLSGNTQPPMQSLGALIWLTSPALVGILLRAFGGDGWKDAGFGLNLISAWKCYLLAFLAYPLAALLTFVVALGFKAIKIDGFVTQGFGAFASAVGVIFLGSLMKNIFEEFAWRGYLTPRLDAAGIPPMINHLIVGILWWSWHLPYYYYFLDRTVLMSYITTNIPVFLIIGIFVLFPTAILFGELRLKSKSVWPVFILHNVLNALSMPLLINGFIKLNGPLSSFFTPTNEGILVSIFFGLMGWFLYKNRMQKVTA